MQSGEKTHVALVDKAANLTTALVMKSKHVTSSTVVDEYHDDGTSTSDSHTINIRDYGDDEIYVTETRVSVVETRFPKIKVV